MTLEELKAMDDEVITPAIAASFLKCNQQDLRTAAHQEREKLGFPVNITKRRVRIPRRAFIAFLEGGGPWFSRERGMGQDNA